MAKKALHDVKISPSALYARGEGMAQVMQTEARDVCGLEQSPGTSRIGGQRGPMLHNSGDLSSVNDSKLTIHVSVETEQESWLRTTSGGIVYAA